MYRIRNQGIGLVELVFVMALAGLMIGVGGAAIRWLSSDYQQVTLLQSTTQLFQMMESKVRHDLIVANSMNFEDGIAIKYTSPDGVVESSYRTVCQQREGWVWQSDVDSVDCSNPCMKDQISRVEVSRCSGGTCTTHHYPAGIAEDKMGLMVCFAEQGGAVLMKLRSIQRSSTGSQIVRSQQVVLNESGVLSNRVKLIE